MRLRQRSKRKRQQRQFQGRAENTETTDGITGGGRKSREWAFRAIDSGSSDPDGYNPRNC